MLKVTKVINRTRGATIIKGEVKKKKKRAESLLEEKIRKIETVEEWRRFNKRYGHLVKCE